MMKIGSVAEATAAKPDIERIVRAWCDWRDAEGGATKQRPASRAKKVTAKPRAAAQTGPAPKQRGR